MNIIDTLRKKKEQLSSRLGELWGLAEQAQKELAKVEEIEEVKAEIQAVDGQLEQAVIQEAREKILPLEERARALNAEEKTLYARIKEIYKERAECKAKARNLVPTRRVQISSAHFIRMRQAYVEKVFVGLNAVEGGLVQPLYCDQQKWREYVVGRHRIEEMLQAGLTLAPGEVIPPPEELTNENSELRPIFPLPEILS